MSDRRIPKPAHRRLGGAAKPEFENDVDVSTEIRRARSNRSGLNALKKAMRVKSQVKPGQSLESLLKKRAKRKLKGAVLGSRG